MTLEFSNGLKRKKSRAGNEKCNNNSSRSLRLRLFVWARLRRNQSDDINSNNNNDVPLGKQHTGKEAGKARKAGGREINCQLKIDQRKWENCAKCKGKVRRWRWCSSSSRRRRGRWRKRNIDRPKRTFWALSTLRQVEKDAKCNKASLYIYIYYGIFPLYFVGALNIRRLRGNAFTEKIQKCKRRDRRESARENRLGKATMFHLHSRHSRHSTDSRETVYLQTLQWLFSGFVFALLSFTLSHKFVF